MPVLKICGNCGGSFSVPRRRNESVKFCSLPCKSAARRVTLKCIACGEAFERRKSDGKGQPKYCSRTCFHADQKGKPKAADPAAQRYYKVCEACGGSFRVTLTRKDTAKFCSRKCLSSSPEYRAKCSEIQQGEKNWRWKGGKYKTRDGYIRHKRKSLDKTTVTFNHRVVVFKALFSADPLHPFIIEVDGVKKLNPEIEVHHIDRDRANNSLDNLLAVTKYAHSQIHHRNRKPKPWECWPSNPERW